jgi:hypothetical protein
MVFVDMLIELYKMLNNKHLIDRLVILVVDRQPFPVQLLIQPVRIMVMEVHLELVVLVV